MFNLGLSEILIIGVLALVFIGPKELPEVARVIGRFLNELKRATGDLTQNFFDEQKSKLAEHRAAGQKENTDSEPAKAEAAGKSGDPV